MLIVALEKKYEIALDTRHALRYYSRVGLDAPHLKRDRKMRVLVAGARAVRSLKTEQYSSK
jgi:hypothetical protein